jgi:hypothetical protein
LAKTVGDQQDKNHKEENRAAIEDISRGRLGQDVVHDSAAGRKTSMCFSISMPPFAAMPDVVPAAD